MNLKTPPTIAIAIILAAVPGCHSLPDTHDFSAHIEGIEEKYNPRCEAERLQRRKEISECLVEWAKGGSIVGRPLRVLTTLVDITDAIAHAEFASVVYYAAKDQRRLRQVNFCLASKGKEILPDLRLPEHRRPSKPKDELKSGARQKSDVCGRSVSDAALGGDF